MKHNPRTNILGGFVNNTDAIVLFIGFVTITPPLRSEVKAFAQDWRGDRLKLETYFTPHWGHVGAHSSDDNRNSLERLGRAPYWYKTCEDRYELTYEGSARLSYLQGDFDRGFKKFLASLETSLDFGPAAPKSLPIEPAKVYWTNRLVDRDHFKNDPVRVQVLDVVDGVAMCLYMCEFATRPGREFMTYTVSFVNRRTDELFTTEDACSTHTKKTLLESKHRKLLIELESITAELQTMR
ncbi:MAG: hypothetical protein WCV62_06735 [Candidatus Peribacteraceae bacterium]